MTFENLPIDLHIFYCQFFEQVEVDLYTMEDGREAISVQGDRGTTVYSFTLIKSHIEELRDAGTLEDVLRTELSNMFKEKDLRDYMKRLRGL